MRITFEDKKQAYINPDVPENQKFMSYDFNNVKNAINELGSAIKLQPGVNPGEYKFKMTGELNVGDTFYVSFDNVTGSENPILISVDDGKIYNFITNKETNITENDIFLNEKKYIKIIYTGTDFITFDIKFQKILWEGEWYMQEGQEAMLSETVDKQENGIVLVFQAYRNGQIQKYEVKSYFIPKKQVELLEGVGHSFFMHSGNLNNVGTKYLYIYKDRIKGNKNNTGAGTASGITFDNRYYVLHYVIGV